MQMITCPGCERPNGKAARFCLYCGYRFHTEPVTAGWGHEAPRLPEVRERLSCDNCAAPLEEAMHGSQRCDYCGTRYGRGQGGVPVIIINSSDSSGGFESGPDPAKLMEEALGAVFSSRRRRRDSWEVFRFGMGHGCVVALLALPLRVIFRSLFR